MAARHLEDSSQQQGQCSEKSPACPPAQGGGWRLEGGGGTEEDLEDLEDLYLAALYRTAFDLALSVWCSGESALCVVCSV